MRRSPGNPGLSFAAPALCASGHRLTGADGGPIEVKQILSPEFVAALREINGDGNDAA
ncbi:MAG: hypothetical protein LBO64_10440 [Desulfovibrio sp.]|nr:hypothetical protein [Desulfovibrio sp.]